MADTIKRANNHITVVKNAKDMQVLDKGLIIGFGAGDITSQMRGIA